MLLSLQLSDLRDKHFNLIVFAFDLGQQPGEVLLKFAELSWPFSIIVSDFVSHPLQFSRSHSKFALEILVSRFLSTEEGVQLSVSAFSVLEVVYISNALVLYKDMCTFSCSQIFWSSAMRRSSFWVLLSLFLRSSHSLVFSRAIDPTFSFSILWL